MEVRDLGLVAAIIVGVNPPIEKKVIWYNTVTNLHYYWDVFELVWKPLNSNAPVTTFVGNLFLAASATGINCSSSGNNLLTWSTDFNAANTSFLSARIEYNAGTFDDNCHAEISLDTNDNLVLFQVVDLLSSLNVNRRINVPAIQNFVNKTGDLQFTITQPSGNSGCKVDVYIYGIKIV